jgi:hypothetical protein
VDFDLDELLRELKGDAVRISDEELSLNKYGIEWHGHKLQALSREGVSNGWPTLLE